MKIYIGLIMALISGTTLADGFAPTAQELKSLPPYCTPRILENDPAGWAAGVAQYGEGWNHMHHNCYALNFINRYYRARDAETKKDALKQAIGNFDYMLTRTSEQYFMRGQILLDKARAMILQGNKSQGLGEVQRALSLDPTLEAGYRFLADYYSDMRKTGEALEWVTTGLKHVPGSRSLQRRYRELGGREPFPEPISKPEPQVVQVPQERSTDNNGDEKTVGTTQAEEQPNSSSADLKFEPEPGTAGPKIGSPKNPYCRFCPD